MTIAEALNRSRWTNAKTYPDAPHEYILAERFPEVHQLFQRLIREEGVREKFTLRGRTYTYRYFYHGPYKYWIIQNVLNRCQVQPPATLQA